MAKRRLDPPSAATLAALDAEFRSETTPRPGKPSAPIAQVAGDSAQLGSGTSAADRLDRLDAQRLRDAEDKGLLVQEIALDQIAEDNMVRDRTVLNQSDLDELMASIATSGLRLPIEVYARADGTFSLLSGYRRLLAFRTLAESDPERFGRIKAFVRPRHDMAGSFRSMIEENEIRANLSHYERGRIAVLAAEQGAFGSTEEAINSLFMHASKSKRSKLRSFAEIFECLGDVLSFAEDLSERRGLRLAGAIRQGGEDRLRETLARGQGVSADLEWRSLEPVIEEIEAGPQQRARQGRPKTPMVPGWTGKDTVRLSSGVTLTKGSDSNGYFIRIAGPSVDQETLEAALMHLQHVFEAP